LAKFLDGENLLKEKEKGEEGGCSREEGRGGYPLLILQNPLRGGMKGAG